ncbi:MAG TPA: HAD family hydrolase [Phycisphaerae bacterium]|nr:HAD family hydrolase [Phycisphaerae bacterium]
MTQTPSATPRDRRRAYIFDLDGTLIDSLEDISVALNAARSDLGLFPVDANQVRNWVGDGLSTLCRRSAPDVGDTVLSRLIERAAHHYAQRPVVHTGTYSNILQLLNLLQSRGAPLAVLSNKPHALAVEIVARLGLAPYFTAVRGSHHEKDRKPDPRAAIEIAALMHVAPEEVYMVGDSVVDIQTARHAGTKSVAVAWGFQNRDVLEAAQPDFFVSDPLEIANLP